MDTMWDMIWDAPKRPNVEKRKVFWMERWIQEKRPNIPKHCERGVQISPAVFQKSPAFPEITSSYAIHHILHLCR